MSIQENGLIRIHGQEGILVVFEFTTASGAARDMTGATVKLKTPLFEKALTVGDTTNTMVLTLQPSDIRPQMVNKKTPYVIVDESGAVPHVILASDIMVSGWK